MKKLLTILLFLSSFAVFGQGDQTAINLNCNCAVAGNNFPALLHTPATYAANPAKKYPVIFFLHGAGEAGVDDGSQLNKIYTSTESGGPAYFIAQNQWPDSFQVNGVWYEPFVVSPQAPGWSTSSQQLDYIIQDFVSKYRVDTNRIYITGLSAGGEGIINYAGRALDNNTPFGVFAPRYKAAAMVPMSQANGQSQGKADYAVADSVYAWGFGDTANDSHGVAEKLQMQYMNNDKAGIARFTNTYPDGHNHFNKHYNPTYTESINGQNLNIYQWMFQYARPGSSGGSSGGGTSACNGTKYVITPSTSDSGKIISSASAAVYKPGDTLVLSAFNSSWNYLDITGLHGSATCPIVIINKDGQVKLRGGIKLSHSTYVKVTGTGVNGVQYGFRCANDTGTVSGVGYTVFGRSAFIEFDHLEVYKKVYAVWCKTEVLEANCADSLWYPAWHMDNMKFHDIKARNINQDGFYIGSTSPNGQRSVTCNGVTSYPIPLRLSNIQIYNNIIDSCVRTGIQLSGADSGYNAIYNNTVTNCGYQYDVAQGAGIAFGGDTHGEIYGNKVRSTYNAGIYSFGSELVNIHDNDVDSSGYLHLFNPSRDTTAGGMASYMIDTRMTAPDTLYSRFIIQNNKAGVNTDKHIRVYKSYDIYYPSGNFICNNTTQSGGAVTISVQAGVKWLSSCVRDYFLKHKGRKIIFQ